MEIETDLDKSLEQLEQDYWDPPTFKSHVVTQCHRIRKIPLMHLTNEELRLAIGQEMGLRHLLPVAIDRLRNDTLASGDFFEGDLLLNILRAPTAIWEIFPSLREEIGIIAEQFFQATSKLNITWHQTCEPDIRAAYIEFQNDRI